MTPTDRIRSVVPPYLLRAVADAEHFPRAAEAARTALASLDTVRAPKQDHRATPQTASGTVNRSPQRTISDAHGSTTLPGTAVRHEGDPVSGNVRRARQHTVTACPAPSLLPLREKSLPRT